MKKNKTVTVFSTSDSEKGSPTGIYENYQQLALAVVGLACKDYEATLRKLYRHPRGKEKVALLLDKGNSIPFFTQHGLRCCQTWMGTTYSVE